MDGIDIRDISPRLAAVKTLARRKQDVFLFSTTIRNNIALRHAGCHRSRSPRRAKAAQIQQILS